VAIDDGGVTVLDLTRVVHDDNLREERSDFLSWIILCIGCNVSSADVFYRNTPDIETNIVTWLGFSKGFVEHFDCSAFSLNF
jgi:hypothetical protein